MEKIAILSDVHGNLFALNSVLNDIKKRRIKRIFCLGDSIFNCNHPDLVIDKLKEVCEIVLIGNTDYAICNPDVKDKNFWTRKCIGEKRAEYILNLPRSHEFYMSGHLIRLFHASPHNLVDIFNPMYPSTMFRSNKPILSSADPLFENTEFIGKSKSDKIPDIVCYGHIHTPFITRYKNKTLLNPGSVGIPVEMLNKDVDLNSNKFSTLASYIIIEGDYGNLELSSISFQIVRLPYDIDKVVQELESSDMPNKDMVIKSLKSAIPTVYN